MRAVGGSVASRLHRVSHGDEVDVNCAQYFASSSLALVLLFVDGEMSGPVSGLGGLGKI